MKRCCIRTKPCLLTGRYQTLFFVSSLTLYPLRPRASSTTPHAPVTITNSPNFSFSFRRMKRSGEQFDDRIVEVHWEPEMQRWRMMRLRDDKPNGNYVDVVMNIISSIMDGVEKDDVSLCPFPFRIASNCGLCVLTILPMSSFSYNELFPSTAIMRYDSARSIHLPRSHHHRTKRRITASRSPSRALLSSHLTLRITSNQFDLAILVLFVVTTL